MNSKSPLLAFCIVGALLAGIIPPTILRPSMALNNPTQVREWGTLTGGNPTAVEGQTELIFRLEKDPDEGKVPTLKLIDTDTKTFTTLNRYNQWITSSYYSPIAADLDGDGNTEIIAAASGAMQCIEWDGSDASLQWRNDYGLQVGCASLFDFDDDGEYEVIFGLSNSTLLVLNSTDGSRRFSTSLPGGGNPFPAPVVADVDDDGQLEIVLLTDTSFQLICLNASNGNLEWSREIPTSSSSPIVGDFDGDGNTEVVFIGSPGLGKWNAYYCRGTDGETKRTVPIGNIVSASPVAADLNGDGFLEVVVTPTNSKIVVITKDFETKTWTPSPSPSTSPATPAIADIDGDSKPEVVCVDSHLRAFNWNGQIDCKTPGGSWENQGWSPVIFDSDGDSNNYLDIVFFMTTGSNCALYSISTTKTSTQTNRWLTYKNDFRRSGIYGSDILGSDPDILLINYNGSWGNISAGSHQRSFTIKNVGTKTLTGNLTASENLTVDGGSLVNLDLDPDESKIVQVTVHAPKGNFTVDPMAFMILTTNDPDEPKANLTQTGYVTQPEHYVKVKTIHIASYLHPNYINDPDIKVEIQNLGSYPETDITVSLTANGTALDPQTSLPLNLDIGESTDVTFFWDVSETGLGDLGVYELNATAENSDTRDSITTFVEVSYPVSIERHGTFLRKNLTTVEWSTVFTVGDIICLNFSITNMWDTDVNCIPVVEINSSASAIYGYYGLNLILQPGAETFIIPAWRFVDDIESQTHYTAYISVYDKIGNHVRKLADRKQEEFWVNP